MLSLSLIVNEHDMHSFKYSCHYIRTILIHALIFTLPLSVQANENDIDTQLRLNQNIEQQSHKKENALLKDEDYLQDKRPELVLNGQSYPVGHSTNELGRALYVSIKQKKWNAVLYFLNEYQTLSDADPLLLAYAKGAVARIQGKMAVAVKEYRQLLDINPEFLPGQLELARTLFEDHQDQEATKLFAHISDKLDSNNEQQMGVIHTVDNFNNALKQRNAWSTSVALGAIWNDNLNQSSESRTCLLIYLGQCIYERIIPDAIEATGLNYELTLNKKIPLHTHNGLYFRSLLYGKSYDDFSDYNESTLTSQLGYLYQDLDDKIQLAPSFEFSSSGNQAMQSAWGLHSEWTHTFSRQRQFKLQGDYKQLSYKQASYAQNYDGPSYSANATIWQVLPNNWILFGGLDGLDRQADEKQYGYLQFGGRLGVSKSFSDLLNTTLSTSFRQQKYKEYSPILGAKRQDIESSYTLIIKSPRLSVLGFTPNLTLRHSNINSNVNWLYSRENNQISLKLEKSF